MKLTFCAACGTTNNLQQHHPVTRLEHCANSRRPQRAKANNWAHLYGKRRREIDKELLAELERQIPSPDDAAPHADGHFASEAPKTTETPERPSTLDRTMRLTIAKAFGRPIDRSID